MIPDSWMTECPKTLYHVYDGAICVHKDCIKIYPNEHIVTITRATHRLRTKTYPSGWFLYQNEKAEVFTSFWEALRFAMKTFKKFRVIYP